MKRLSLVIAVVSLFAACEESVENKALVPELPGMEQADEAPGKPMLPAWQTEAEKRQPGKADQYSDYKDANPEVYGITQPPTVGIRPVAEWENAQALLLSFSSSGLPTSIKNNIADMAVLGMQVGNVYVIYDSSTSKTSLSNAITARGGNPALVNWLDLGNDSIWMRDFGPVNIVSDAGKVGLLDFRYYHQRVYDDAIPTLLSPSPFNATVYRVPLYYEGGNFMSDTQGNCFASEGLLEAQAVSEATVRAYMQAYAGCDQLYIATKLSGEGTTHIDMQSKIVDDNTIIVAEYVNGEGGYNVTVTDSNAEYFESLGYTVLRFPFPQQGNDVWRTYTNSLFFNNVNMWPVYSINKDREAQALAVWQQAMPTFEHAALNSDEVITWGGAMHCISQTIGSNTLQQIETPDYACNGGWDCDPDIDCNPNCAGKACGDNGCGGSCGSCGANQKCSAAGQCVACTPNCTGKTCGDNGCGGTCGTCSSGFQCNASGQCIETPPITTCPGPNTPVSNDCGEYTDIGCCDASGRLIYCYQNNLFCVDCAGGGNPSCGWEAGNGWYDCGTNGGSDPAGEWPKSCDGNTTCTPNCTGKVCGGDGCGGTCGTCTGGKVCNATGTQCVASTPLGDCLGMNQPSAADCGAINEIGCCNDKGWILYCQDGALYCIDCATDGPQCGWDAQNNFYNCSTNGAADPSGQNPLACTVACTPACTGKECGDDGCGGSCGTCGAGETCTAGQCVGGCTPNCAGKECGTDGCGGTCGNCATGESCVAGVCKAAVCVPACAGMECGADGCGGSCGTCAQGLTCNAGKCSSEACTPSCEGKQCGSDGCEGSCGVCGPQQTCEAGVCKAAVCEPACTGKACGDDGCGGQCGTCLQGETCEEFQCVPEGTCVPKCGEKQCGPDGCGGSCGECADGTACSGGKCVEACVPACGGKECGDDGCGGNCGLCGLGLACTDKGVCVDPDAPTCPSGTLWDGKNCVLEPGSGDTAGGCATTSTSSPASALLVLLALALLAIRRFR